MATANNQAAATCHPGYQALITTPCRSRGAASPWTLLVGEKQGGSPRNRDYDTSQFARNKKLIAARSRPGNRVVTNRPGHPAAMRSDAVPGGHRKCAGPGVSGWIDAEARWQSDVWDRTLPASTVGASGRPGRDFGHAARALLIALTHLLDRLAGRPRLASMTSRPVSPPAGQPQGAHLEFWGLGLRRRGLCSRRGRSLKRRPIPGASNTRGRRSRPYLAPRLPRSTLRDACRSPVQPRFIVEV